MVVPYLRVWRHRLREVGVHHAGLHHRDAVLGVDLEDPVHARALDHHPALQGQGAAGEAGPGAPRHEGHLVGPAGAHHRLHLELVGGQHHGARPGAVVGETVRLVDEELFRTREHGLRAHRVAQGANQLHAG